MTRPAGYQAVSPKPQHRQTPSTALPPPVIKPSTTVAPPGVADEESEYEESEYETESEEEEEEAAPASSVNPATSSTITNQVHTAAGICKGPHIKNM